MGAKIEEKPEEERGKVRLMFEDEAGFGRINKPKYCWCPKGFRAHVPCHHLREFRYAFGAVDPVSGDSFFFSEQYSKDEILLVCDGATWHKSNMLVVPDNIHLFYLPPATPEMNPIEQIWKELRKMGFRNEIFDSLADVVDRLCLTIKNLTAETIRSITGRKWILSCFN